MELRDIGVLMILRTMNLDDVTNWTAVNGEQQRPEYRSLRDADFQICSRWLMLPKFDELRFAAEI